MYGKKVVIYLALLKSDEWEIATYDNNHTFRIDKSGVLLILRGVEIKAAYREYSHVVYE